MPTIIKNGRNYSGTSVSLTQAEYDALPEVTKMNGTTYFITDSEVVLNAEDVALDEGNLNDLAGSVATIETSPATANHEVGEYILWNGVVYVVTSAIATGENLVINSNISARTIGSELTALNNGLTTKTESATGTISANSIDDFIIGIIGDFMTNANAGKTFDITATWAGRDFYGFILFVVGDSLGFGFCTAGSTDSSYAFRYIPGQSFTKTVLG